MKSKRLRNTIFSAFVQVILLLGIFTGLLGYYIIRHDILLRAQRQVRTDLKIARWVWEDELNRMDRSFALISSTGNPTQIRNTLDLDYLYVVELPSGEIAKSDIAQRAAKGNRTCGIRIIDSTELREMGSGIYEKAHIELCPTLKASPTNRKDLTKAMAMECAAPLFGENGAVTRVVYGGKIINRQFELVDKIHNMVYENKLYGSKPMGTVTVFLHDIRIATNVLNKDGDRAIGTRVSEAVYKNVVVKGLPWLDRAFVVTDWYLTAYEPILDINGKNVGILYVGTLEKPFKDLIRARIFYFILIIGSALALGGVLAIFLTNKISRPLTVMVETTAKIRGCDLSHRMDVATPVKEINQLAASFNDMACKLEQHQNQLTLANTELAALNKRYLDLVSLVSHELKGILSSTVMNSYSVRDGHLGPINDAQKSALNSVTRNLDYFDATVNNFLSLSRIEKGDINLHILEFDLGKDIIATSVDAFSRQMQQKGMNLENRIPEKMRVSADASLILVAINNLLGNAIKYGQEKGKITLSAQSTPTEVVITVYNDGTPIAPQEIEKLFIRFSRLDTASQNGVRGTGLGLFLAKEIAEQHGGKIQCEPQKNGNAFIFTFSKNLQKQEPIKNA